MKTYPLAKPSIGAEEIRAVTKVLKSGQLSLGPVFRQFEQAFAKKIGAKYACAVSSGTAGLHLALLAAGIGKGDEVITSPFSFVSSANSVIYTGAKPVFVDIEPATFNLDPNLIEAAITKKTKAILVVHIFGQTANMAPILKIAKKHRLSIIEDACESIQATFRGKKAGTFGLAGVFAFYPNKQMTTGEGGMIVTNDKRVYDLCCSLRNQGRDEKSDWLNHERLGYNYRLNELSAALGLEQLKKLDRLIKNRAQIASWYEKGLKNYRRIMKTPRAAPGNRHTWFLYIIELVNAKIGRQKLMEKLKRRGIMTKPYLPAIHLFPFYRKLFGYGPGDFPVTEKISRSTLALPFYPGLSRKDVNFIIKALIHSLI